jgi:hypothetical protein
MWKCIPVSCINVQKRLGKPRGSQENECSANPIAPAGAESKTKEKTGLGLTSIGYKFTFLFILCRQPILTQKTNLQFGNHI